MSIAPFARLQQRVNRVVVDRLADAMAVVGGGEPFGVLFDSPYASPFAGQIDAAAPECIGPTEKLGDLQRDDTITINGTLYLVLTAEPDGTGMTVLTLGTR